MLLKLGIQLAILGAEVILGIYSLILSDSLLVKFIFFVFSAAIIAFLITRITNKLLPSDQDYISPVQQREEELREK